MKYVLFSWGGLAIMVAIGLFSISRSAVDNVEGMIVLLIGTVALGAAGIIQAVERTGDRIALEVAEKHQGKKAA